ncbi:unnamed protein product [Darwinula stevensoni]|uniref:Uncharacterized protein n=1 Tax=Darwinula stevensoni TaxID=69355 RepID=A0A7R9A797_9CRUS|nr:unnamed protein product [Darwinula stevensoni]CAG0890827.1 unnamed protein product [Darwinula stevensoni]
MDRKSSFAISHHPVIMSPDAFIPIPSTRDEHMLIEECDCMTLERNRNIRPRLSAEVQAYFPGISHPSHEEKRVLNDNSRGIINEEWRGNAEHLIPLVGGLMGILLLHMEDLHFLPSAVNEFAEEMREDGGGGGLDAPSPTRVPTGFALLDELRCRR